MRGRATRGKGFPSDPVAPCVTFCGVMLGFRTEYCALACTYLFGYCWAVRLNSLRSHVGILLPLAWCPIPSRRPAVPRSKTGQSRYSSCRLQIWVDSRQYSITASYRRRRKCSLNRKYLFLLPNRFQGRFVTTPHPPPFPTVPHQAR